VGHDQFTEPLQTDWQAGDVALCILGGKISDATVVPREYPKAGTFYTVESVGELMFYLGKFKALWFKDAPINTNNERVWPQYRFIKVTPPADMKLGEEEREKEKVE
jgi:hypothetical protein